MLAAPASRGTHPNPSRREGLSEAGVAPAQDVLGGAAGGFFVGAVGGDGVEALEGLMGGLGVEGLRALVGDLADEAEGGADVGLARPLGEFEDVGVELVGDFGQARVVVEPGFDAGLVVVGEEGAGRRREGVGG